MSKINFGGPAFPVTAPRQDGISLRDWFAGQAMAAHIQNAGLHFHERPEEYEKCRSATARRSYAIADAMLATRALPSNQEQGEKA